MECQKLEFDIKGDAMLDLDTIRRDYPCLEQMVHDSPLVYLDSAATSQTPRAVVETVQGFYERDCSNVHRAVYKLSERATRDFEAARLKVQRLLNASDSREIIFTQGTTEAINLVARCYGDANIGPGDEVIVSVMEHHSNIVPWQMLCERRGAALKVVDINEAGELRLEQYDDLLSERTKLVAVAHTSNVLGTHNPIAVMTELAHERGAVVVVDGAQSISHQAVDVQSLDCDFYAFSSHKMYGPTGVGVLYGRESLLEAMPPFHGGGDMIRTVTFEKTTYNDLPYKFEAGTPNVAGVIGLGAAVDYLTALGVDNIGAYEQSLLQYATERLLSVPGLRLVGTARDKAAVCSFVMEGAHPHDIATILDHQGIAIRSGHHCAQPLMERYDLPATARASFAVYNRLEDVDALVRGLRRVNEVFCV